MSPAASGSKGKSSKARRSTSDTKKKRYTFIKIKQSSDTIQVLTWQLTSENSNEHAQNDRQAWSASHTQPTDLSEQTDPYGEDVDKYMQRINEAVAAGMTSKNCPCHGQILAGTTHRVGSGEGLGAMERYLKEGAYEQYTIVEQPGTGYWSIGKGCTCGNFIEGGVNAGGKKN